MPQRDVNWKKSLSRWFDPESDRVETQLCVRFMLRFIWSVALKNQSWCHRLYLMVWFESNDTSQNCMNERAMEIIVILKCSCIFEWHKKLPPNFFQTHTRQKPKLGLGCIQNRRRQTFKKLLGVLLQLTGCIAVMMYYPTRRGVVVILCNPQIRFPF